MHRPSIELAVSSVLRSAPTSRFRSSNALTNIHIHKRHKYGTKGKIKKYTHVHDINWKECTNAHVAWDEFGKLERSSPQIREVQSGSSRTGRHTGIHKYRYGDRNNDRRTMSRMVVYAEG